MRNTQSDQLFNKSATALELIVAPVDEEIKSVNQFIINELKSDIVLINSVSSYIINNGGKRLRPVILLLAAGACGNQTQHHTALAAIIEFIHTATLLHDDVVDDSTLRRGKATANTVWGNQASVLVGDFLYSRAFQQMVKIGSLRIMGVLADTTNEIAQGEVMQLMNSHSADLSADDYYETIRRKTAVLFESACQLGAIISSSPKEIELALAAYGLNMGIAFQIIDDILDYSGDVKKTGKNIGDDLSDGKVTLPLIRALMQLSETERIVLINTIENGVEQSEIQNIVKLISSTDALSYSKAQAVKHTDKAINSLSIVPDSMYKTALIDLASFFIKRVY